MKTKRYFKSMILTLAVSGMCMQTLAGAQENSQLQPTYSNAAEARQAAHMAGQGANTANPSLQAALMNLNEAENQMDRVQMSGNQSRMMSAETTLNTAEDKYVGMLSDMTGVSATDISDMHTAGAGWAEIAGELGMNVSATGQMAGSGQGGMGNGQMTTGGQGNMGTGQMTGGSGQGTMQQGNMGGQINSGSTGSMMDPQSAEIMAATARNTESGWAEGHGTGMQTGVQGSGSGGMMSGAGGMGSAEGEGHGSATAGGMGGGMGASSSGGSSGGSGSSGGMGSGSSSGGGMGGGSGSGGGGGMM